MSRPTVTTVQPALLPPLPPGSPASFPVLIAGLRVVRERKRSVLVERIAGTRGRAWLPLSQTRLHPTDFYMTEWSATVPPWLYRKVRPLL